MPFQLPSPDAMAARLPLDDDEGLLEPLNSPQHHYDPKRTNGDKFSQGIRILAAEDNLIK
jgi:hypothetical protein